MGDIFSPGVRDEWIEAVLDRVRRFPHTQFLFLTKNPERYRDFVSKMHENAILGATIETNRDNLYVERRISYAPLPSSRYIAMKELRWPYKFISIEPILDFDLEIFTSWLRDIAPRLVYIGYDNYDWRLPEPPLSKTMKLVEELRKITKVELKSMRRAWHEGRASRSPRTRVEDYEGFKSYSGVYA